MHALRAPNPIQAISFEFLAKVTKDKPGTQPGS
jgi:hypothetical protein